MKTPFVASDVEFAGIQLSPARYRSSGHQSVAHRRRQDDGIVDSVAVVRALRGEPLPISLREVVAAVALGAKSGLSDDDLSERLGIAERNVFRLRSLHNIPPCTPPTWERHNEKEAVA